MLLLLRTAISRGGAEGAENCPRHRDPCAAANKSIWGCGWRGAARRRQVLDPERRCRFLDSLRSLGMTALSFRAKGRRPGVEESAPPLRLRVKHVAGAPV